MLGAVFQPLTHSLRTLSSVACDLVPLLVLVSRSRRTLASENLFLRKPLALFQERKVKPHRADDSTRLIMVILGRLFVGDAFLSPGWILCGHLLNESAQVLGEAA